jgi:hypothetical protein
MEWRQIAPDFAFDGSWRDIYVLAATLSDRQLVLDMLRRFEPPPTYSLDGITTALPDRIEDVFKSRASATALLSFSVGQIALNCHFFGKNEIEFDLDPREVDDADRFEALVGFLRRLGELTDKTVLLTPENHQQSPILRYSPDTREVTWIPWESKR